MAARVCPQCGCQQPEDSTAPECVSCGAALAAAEAPPAAPEHLEPGKRACPQCGEVLYETERRCWRCGHELAEAPAAELPAVEAPPVAPPATVPGAAPPGPPPVAATPTGAPSLLPPPPGAAAPPPTAPAVVTPPLAAPPYVSGAAPPALHPNAQTFAIWAFVLALMSILTCFGLTAPVAIVLGVQANRLGRNTLGTAAIVLGIFGMLVLGFWILGFVLSAGGNPAPK